jgi:hypothetical protein
LSAEKRLSRRSREMKKNSIGTHLLQCKKENRNRGATALLDYLAGHAIHEDNVRKRLKELFNRISVNENSHSFDLLGAQDKLSAAHSAKTLTYLTKMQQSTEDWT